MSGINLPGGRRIRKGAADAVAKFVREQGGVPMDVSPLVDGVASRGATPLVVADGPKVVGVVVLEDILKPSMKERFDRLRKMGLRTVMITGDNPLTAATIAKQAGVDDFLAEATPEDKLEYIRKEQAEGKLIAMMGDGTNDAPALAQADVALAMNAGTQALKKPAIWWILTAIPLRSLRLLKLVNSCW
jgi:K+-transporting ATPase ATPase B chain